MQSNRFPPAGAAHPRVRQYLNVRGHRAKCPPGALAIEGVWALRHATAAHVPIEVVFICIGLVRGDESYRVVEQARASGAVVFEVGQRVFSRMVERDGPDGIAAIAYLPSWSLDELAVDRTTRLVVLDRIELAGNLGAIVRCADAAGASGVILTDRRTRPTHPLAVKASMGSIFTMPVIDATEASAIEWLRGNNIRMVAADPCARVSYRDADYASRIALVLGSERYGLSATWRAAADVLVSIPMLGVADSLNIGHAAALLLYESLHQGQEDF